ncbi:SRPBCC family protein [Nocardioides dubius]|uniref:Polyketide cyclase / dehydrase and lipid transport n=1 Tax=Nocardioides dubius TaxID=317019 RepID=A0ABN1U0D2_9ACTN
MSSQVVHFPCSPQAAFDYLSDPARRPEWQSSLRAVVPLSDPVDGPHAEWIDVTWPGLRPRMRTTIYEPGVRWAEVGHWRGVSATLELTFDGDDGGTDVAVQFTLSGAGWRRPIVAVAGLLAPGAVIADLRRAALNVT